ncbi:MAG: hypothetical protein AAF438_06250, partial [Pseudomonadota bacterium]
KKNPSKEIGWYEVSTTEEGKHDRLLQFFSTSQPIFQWHSDTFELPRDAVLLARSESCINQAFRYGNNAYGFQFHLEVNAPLIERWLTVDAHQSELASVGGESKAYQIREATQRYIQQNEILGRQTFSEFLALTGSRTRKRILKTR